MSPVVLGVAVVGGPGFGLTIVEAWPFHACSTRTTHRGAACIYVFARSEPGLKRAALE